MTPRPTLLTADTVAPADWNDWRWQTKHRIRSLDGLARALGRPTSAFASAHAAAEEFPVGVSPYYLALADAGDAHDPILRQVLPVEKESTSSRGAEPQEVADPFREDELSPVPGVIHRYADRALIVPTNFCATLCRHCFRKRTWAEGFFALDRDALRTAVGYVRERPAIRDVLVTGGDPLHLAVDVLASLLDDLRSIPHLEVLRVASRVPVTLPQRIDAEMVTLLARVKPLWFITHFNHAREVTPAAGAALRALLDAGITVQNQTVLLAGVNDSTETQLELSRALLRLGVRPYYLHLADPVAGAGHFRVPIERALDVVRGMFGKIAGFGIPRLVIDLPGGKGKIPLLPDFCIARAGDDLWFESPIDGDAVRYANPK